MTYIVERLRAFEGSDDLGNGDFSVCVQAAEHIIVLQALLAECAGDLRAYIEQAYPAETRTYPVMERRFKRDILPVELAETILAEITRLSTPLQESAA